MWHLAVSEGVWDLPFLTPCQLSSVSRTEKASPKGLLVATRTRFLGESSGLKMGRSSAWKLFNLELVDPGDPLHAWPAELRLGSPDDGLQRRPVAVGAEAWACSL